MRHTTPTATAVAHRLLFDALVAIREEGRGNPGVVRLADLFHTAALDLRAAAEGEIGYEEVRRRLDAKARETGCEKWLDAATGRAESAERDRLESCP